MKISEYCDAINVSLIITRYSNQKERWAARFEYCEIAENGCLVSSSGDGHTPTEAIDAYIKEIRGRKIVLNAMSTSRREFVVPATLEGI